MSEQHVSSDTQLCKSKPIDLEIVVDVEVDV